MSRTQPILEALHEAMLDELIERPTTGAFQLLGECAAPGCDVNRCGPESEFCFSHTYEGEGIDGTWEC